MSKNIVRVGRRAKVLRITKAVLVIGIIVCIMILIYILASAKMEGASMLDIYYSLRGNHIDSKAAFGKKKNYITIGKDGAVEVNASDLSDDTDEQDNADSQQVAVSHGTKINDKYIQAFKDAGLNDDKALAQVAIYQVFKSYGYDNNQIAGILSNNMAEGTLDSVETNYASYIEQGMAAGKIGNEYAWTYPSGSDYHIRTKADLEWLIKYPSDYKGPEGPYKNSKGKSVKIKYNSLGAGPFGFSFVLRVEYCQYILKYVKSGNVTTDNLFDGFIDMCDAHFKPGCGYYNDFQTCSQKYSHDATGYAYAFMHAVESPKIGDSTDYAKKHIENANKMLDIISKF